MSSDDEIRLAIIGSREFNRQNYFESVMAQFLEDYGMPSLVVSGGCRGADIMGERWADREGVRKRILKPDWDTHGKKAGLLRNRDIVDLCTHVVAFPSKTGTGTQHALRLARDRGKHCTVMDDWE